MSKYISNGKFDEMYYEEWPYESENKIHVKKVLFDGKSEYQDILIFDSTNFGRVLVLDGGLQITTSDEFSYHEMIAFTALACHKSPKNVLIVGGGDGGMAKQVLKFPTVEYLQVCDIDKLVTDSCKEHFPDTASSFSHPKCKLITGDALKYLSECRQGSFDVILVDCTDPTTPIAENLFGKEFYKNLNKALSEHGIAAAQNGGSMWQSYESQRNLMKTVKEIFPTVETTFMSVPSFSCGQNGFLICSKDKDHNLSEPYWKFNDVELDKMNMLYYDTQLHTSSFHLPRFVRKYLYEDVNNSEEEIKDNDYAHLQIMKRTNKSVP